MRMQPGAAPNVRTVGHTHALCMLCYDVFAACVLHIQPGAAPALKTLDHAEHAVHAVLHCVGFTVVLFHRETRMQLRVQQP